MILHLFTEEHLIGTAGTWIRKPIGHHTMVAIPRLRLEHRFAMSFAEGASLLHIFQGCHCNLGRVVVLSGRFELFVRSTPTLYEVIGFVEHPTDEYPPPTLAEMIRVGAAALRGE